MQIEWRGREWEIRPATPTEIELHMENKNGAVFEDAGVIVFNPRAPQDLQIMSVLHEIGHVMYPEWSDEPHEKSKSELGIFERDLKAFLEAAGVDLSWLIREASEDEEE